MSRHDRRSSFASFIAIDLIGWSEDKAELGFRSLFSVNAET